MHMISVHCYRTERFFARGNKEDWTDVSLPNARTYFPVWGWLLELYSGFLGNPKEICCIIVESYSANYGRILTVFPSNKHHFTFKTIMM